MSILIVMIKREGKVITPRGATILKAGDRILLASDNKTDLFEIDEKARKSSFY